MVTVIASHEVKDFSSWKELFDADSPRRDAAGVKLAGMYQGIENPNKVTFLLEVPAMEILDRMMNDPELQERMKLGGVLTTEFNVVKKA